MIKLTRIPEPQRLVDERDSLRDEYRNTKNDVWNQDYIKEALLEMSHGKCIFCECRIDEESKYLEVEHFHPKSLYPEEVVDWENLLPICKRCNVRKRSHDTKAHPIINPTVHDPRKHLRIKNYRFKGKDQLGTDTIQVLTLNDSDRLIQPRMMIGNEAIEIIEDLFQDINALGDLNESRITKQVNNCLRRLRRVLKSCQPQSEYSAVCSTAVLGEDAYHDIVRIIKNYDLWNDELEDLDRGARKTSYTEKVVEASAQTG